jgi:hypothetical protein
MIDLTDTKKVPTVKSTIQISLGKWIENIEVDYLCVIDCMKSPSSSKKLFEMQKQLGIRMQAKRAAMLAENNINLPTNDDDEDEVEEVDEDSMDSTNGSNDANSEIISNVDKENVRRKKFVFSNEKFIFF